MSMVGKYCCIVDPNLELHLPCQQLVELSLLGGQHLGRLSSYLEKDPVFPLLLQYIVTTYDTILLTVHQDLHEEWYRGIYNYSNKTLGEGAGLK